MNLARSRHFRASPLVLAAAAVLASGSARAEDQAADAAAHSPPVHFAFLYKADLMDVASGGVSHAAGYVDQIVGSADADLDRMAGLTGVSAHVDLMRSLTTSMSARAGSVLGVDQAEVPTDRVRLAQAWVQKSFGGGKASVLVGFYDLTGEFDVTPSSGLLISTSFGISADLNASGPAGPSAFPVTSFSVRGRLQPSETTYAQVAVLNARAAAPGDPGGPDFSFEDGVLVAGEVGYTKTGKIAVGAWRYSKARPVLRPTDPAGAESRQAGGVYALVERPLGPAEGVRRTTGFLKAGVSEGRTSAFRGSWQAGLLMQQILKARPDSQLSLGVSQGRLSRDFIGLARDVGLDTGRAETIVELTGSDQLAAHLRLQPDLQWVHRPAGSREVNDALVVGLRATVNF